MHVTNEDLWRGLVVISHQVKSCEHKLIRLLREKGEDEKLLAAANHLRDHTQAVKDALQSNVPPETQPQPQQPIERQTPTMSAKKVSGIVQQVIDNITNANTVDDSVLVFIGGVPGMIQAAVAEAMENGATGEQLQPLSDLGTLLQQKSDAIAEAIRTPGPGPANAPKAA